MTKKEKKSGIGRFYSMEGRRNRKSLLLIWLSLFLLSTFFYIILYAILAVLNEMTPQQIESSLSGIDNPLVILFHVVFTIPISLSAVVQRLHDIGSSGYWALFLLVPLGNVIFVIFVVLLPVTKEHNRFGPVPS